MAWDECPCRVQETLKFRDNRHRNGIITWPFQLSFFSKLVEFFMAFQGLVNTYKVADGFIGSWLFQRGCTTLRCVCFRVSSCTVSVEMYSAELSHGHAHAQNNLVWCFCRRLDLTWGPLFLLRLRWTDACNYSILDEILTATVV